jgi:hypothetical protein
MIHRQVTVENTAELLATQAYGAGALLRWESAALQAGPFTEGGTIALVSGQSVYDVWDAAGVEGVTCYQTRISNAGGTTFSAYSDVLPGGVPAAYATLADVLATFETPITDQRKFARMTSLLTTATNQVIEECGGRDYFRHPASGTETWFGSVGRTFRPRGVYDYGLLHEHGGITSLASLEVSQDLGGSFTVVPSGDYVLRGADPDSSAPPPIGEPFFHVVFTGIGTVQGLPRGVNVVRLTGVRGWPAIPPALVEATAQRAHQLAFASAGYSGGDAGGPDQYGRISPTDRFWPQSLYNFIQSERERFYCHV